MLPYTLGRGNFLNIIKIPIYPPTLIKYTAWYFQLR